MSPKESFRLILPKPKSDPTHSGIIETPGPIVIVGANGSGKSRLGTWIDIHSAQADRTHRISAQRSLNMPLFSSPTALEMAHKDLLYGRQEGDVHNKHGFRWHNRPEVQMLGDFDKLMVYLFTEEWDASTKYRQDSIENTEKIVPALTKLDRIKAIWETTLPHRQLIIRGGKIETKAPNSNATPYKGSDMSDGERVIFYLIGQALSAPENGIVLIDEPEIHLHKAVQARLWDAIESSRPDCLFVYLTHDVDFAASRISAKKICLREYDGSNWDWFEIPQNSEMPENVLLEIVGSRRPILFIEGDLASLDYNVFQRVYPEKTIVPRSGCEQVIHSVATFNALHTLHRLSASGIVDRDFRNAEEISYLRARDIFVLEAVEMENVLLFEDVLSFVATKLHLSDPQTVIGKIKDQVLSQLKTQKELVVSRLTVAEIDRRLKSFDTKVKGESAIQSSVEALMRSLEVDKLYKANADVVENILSAQDYAGALKLFAQKGLLSQVSSHFGLRPSEYENYLRRLIASNEGPELVKILKSHLPILPS